MREIELKGVVEAPEAVRQALIAAGAGCTFEGALVDWRYDTPDRRLRQRDEVLRLRMTRGGDGAEQGRVDFKGPTSYPEGYKVRDEVGTSIGDPTVLDTILRGLGYQVVREIERLVEVWELQGVVIRFEWYPRMDVLVEVEGNPQGIEHAIGVMGLGREVFTSERLSDFARRFQVRTGVRAALSARELGGDYSHTLDDA
jgi:predicted adenylyl cyclase CyaB